MRYLVTYLILLAFVFQIANRIYVLIDFQVNQKFIAENLCEKKDEPESCCEGSCHLSKELVKIEEKEDQSPANPSQTKKEKTEELVYIQTNKAKLKPRKHNLDLVRTSIEDNLQPGFVTKPFHPPAQ